MIGMPTGRGGRSATGRTWSIRGALAVWMACGSLAASCKGLAARQVAEVQELSSTIDSLRRAWDIPGIAVSVVTRDSVVMARGFGTREVGGRAPTANVEVSSVDGDGRVQEYATGR